MTTDLLPFDLQTALREPERVRNEYGAVAAQVVHVPSASPPYRVLVAWSGISTPMFFHEDGRYTRWSDKDALFLAPKTRKVWVRVWMNCINEPMAVVEANPGDFDRTRRYIDADPTEIEIREDA